MSHSREEWLAEMVEILGVDPEDVLEVTGMFFDGIEERLYAIYQAHESGDLEEVTRLVHGLKGDAANIGFKQSSAVARKMETQCRDGSINDFAGQFQALKDALQARRKAIGFDTTDA